MVWYHLFYMREIYYSRHGITVDLENGIRNRPDTELTPAGREEARATGRQLLARFIVPKIIVCSGLVRARQSAEEIADVIGFDPAAIIEEDLFNERECGIAVGMRNKEIKRVYPGGFDDVPGAESTEALQARAAAMAAYLEAFEEDTVLAVGHGVTGRAIARHYNGRPYTEEFDRPTRDKVNLKNGQIMRLSPGPVELFPLD